MKEIVQAIQLIDDKAFIDIEDETLIVVCGNSKWRAINDYISKIDELFSLRRIEDCHLKYAQPPSFTRHFFICIMSSSKEHLTSVYKNVKERLKDGYYTPTAY